jgi:hypothetical protein
MALQRCSCCDLKLPQHRLYQNPDTGAARPYWRAKTSQICQRSTQRTPNSTNIFRGPSSIDEEPPPSRLLSIPLELREIIWEFTLAPPVDSRPAHFHIYDRVYDSCTYEHPDCPMSTHRKNARRKAQQTSLLLTCRSVYEEALPWLYNHSAFKLVIFAGSARPKKSLKSKHCIGKLDDCKRVFQLMRSIHIVVQPGPRHDYLPFKLSTEPFEYSC